MKNCQEFQELLQSYVAGEISPSGLEELHEHCRTCVDCADLMEIHAQLADRGASAREPDQNEFANMRAAVLGRITENPAVWTKRRRWWHVGRNTRLRPVWAVPLAAVLVVISVLAGRWSVPAAPLDDDALLREISRHATKQAGLIDFWETPYTYTNVSARPAGDGKLDLSFDVCRRVNMVTPMDSPLASEVLLHAILEPSALGSRIKAMELTGEILDPKLTEAMIYTLHNDPDLAVRTEAMSVLGRYPYDADIQDALLTTLREDTEVQMRLLALDYLSGKQVNMDTIRRAIRERKMDSDPAVLQYASDLIDN
jgi:hypothetical protein